MPAYETEYMGMSPASYDNGVGVVLVTVRLNRSKGSLVPIQLELSRAQLERILEDGTHILETSEVMNTPETIELSSQRVAPEELPVFDDDGKMKVLTTIQL